MNDLLTETVVVPASSKTLRQRLQYQLAEREHRKRSQKNYPGNISDQWLEERIGLLEAELAERASGEASNG